ncbi:MAG: MurR/RpiR family transcriptional regulator [Alphaproteobacteria bacterium]|nr:MurR/RpiR family transcriptional regulator [Alphaproteobacteria bacterium]
MESRELSWDYPRLHRAFLDRFETLSPHLKRIARYALSDPSRFALQTVAEISKSCGVQPSTVVRFAKTFGYPGFSDMQNVFRSRLMEGSEAYREQVHEHRGRLGTVSGDDPAAILTEFANASILAVERLKDTLDADMLQRAAALMNEAGAVYLVGWQRALPVASCLAYWLIELEYRCHLLDPAVGTLSRQIGTVAPDELLIVIGLDELPDTLLDAVSAAHNRGVPVLAITDSEVSRLARDSRLCFVLRDAEVHRIAPLAPHIVLVQSLVIAPDALRYAHRSGDLQRGVAG